MSVSDFLGKPVTRDYVPSASLSGWLFSNRLAPFTLHTVNNMLCDSRVTFGLWLIKGPILSHAKFYIKCADPKVKEFIVNTITRFWRTSAIKTLKAIEWGFSCSELLYEYDKRKKLIVFQGLKDIHPLDCRLVTSDGKAIGASVRNVPNHKGAGTKKVTLESPRFLWHVQGREAHPFYGQSRLRGAYQPWTEIWTDGGYRDSRRLFFHKYAFDGGIMYHPPGTTKISGGGGAVAQEISNKDLAREMIEKRKTGGSMTLPNLPGEDGNRQWDYIAPEVQQPPSSLMEYGKDLNDELWEGMGIPPEIARAEGTGAFAGRAIPMMAFFSVLQEILLNLIADVDGCLITPLVQQNFGDVEYEIEPHRLSVPDDFKEQQQQPPLPEPKQ